MADAEKRFKKDLWNDCEMVMFMKTFDGWDNELYHYGIKGQKWGIRRYQNEDGTLTPEGRAKYYTSDGNLTKFGQKQLRKDLKYNTKLQNRANRDYLMDRAKRRIIGGEALTFGTFAGTAGASNYAMGKMDTRRVMDGPSSVREYTVYPGLDKGQTSLINNGAAGLSIALAALGQMRVIGGVIDMARAKNSKGLARAAEKAKAHTDYILERYGDLPSLKKK